MIKKVYMWSLFIMQLKFYSMPTTQMQFMLYSLRVNFDDDDGCVTYSLETAVQLATPLSPLNATPLPAVPDTMVGRCLAVGVLFPMVTYFFFYFSQNCSKFCIQFWMNSLCKYASDHRQIATVIIIITTRPSTWILWSLQDGK